MKVVTFKSLPCFYFKEEGGAKPNTVRIIPASDPRNKALESLTPPTHIRIVNKDNPKFSFKRKITDITFWNGVYIISWKHEGKITWGN